jgi:hypothetical protein
MKLTGWYSGDQKPVNEGVYKRFYCGFFGFCKFNNGKWYVYYDTVELAATAETISKYQCLSWRGLAEEPKKGKATK